MMSIRPYEFFNIDDVARRRCAAWSIGLAGLASAVAAIVGVKNDTAVAFISGVVCSATFVFQLHR